MLTCVLFLVSLFTAVALSAPSKLQKRSFAHHVRRKIDTTHPMAGPNAMMKAYRKYGFNMVNRQAAPNGTAPAAAGPGTGVVAALPEPNGAEYLSPVDIGGQQVTLDFDTGSADLYVLHFISAGQG